MWATHPPHYEREQNLKRRYLRSPFDTRSPWLLFREPEVVRARVTERYYRTLFEVPSDLCLSDPEEVQAVIEGERSEMTYDPCYLGAYDDRFIEPGDLDALTALADHETCDKEQLAHTRAGLFDADSARWIEANHQRRQEEQILAGLSPAVDFEFRGQRYLPGDARRMRNQVRRELDEDDRRWAQFDRKVFLVHYRASRTLRQEVSQELVERYRFHLTAQQFLKQVSAQHDWVASVLGYLSRVTELTGDEYRTIVHGALDAHELLSRSLTVASSVSLPELKHVAAGKSLGQFLLRQRTVADFHLNEKELRPTRLFRTLDKFARELGEMRDRLRRVHFKSLGGLLALQESIWKTTAAVNEKTETSRVSGANA